MRKQRLGPPLCHWRPWGGRGCSKRQYENTTSGVIAITRRWYMLCWTWNMYSEGIVSTEIQSIGCRSELQLVDCKCQPIRNVFILLITNVFQTSPDHQPFCSSSVNSFHFLHYYCLVFSFTYHFVSLISPSVGFEAEYCWTIRSVPWCPIKNTLSLSMVFIALNPDLLKCLLRLRHLHFVFLLRIFIIRY